MVEREECGRHESRRRSLAKGRREHFFEAWPGEFFRRCFLLSGKARAWICPSQIRYRAVGRGREFRPHSDVKQTARATRANVLPQAQRERRDLALREYRERRFRQRWKRDGLDM